MDGWRNAGFLFVCWKLKGKGIEWNGYMIGMVDERGLR